MKDSLQDILLAVPLHQVSYITPLPKDPIYYETTVQTIPDQWLEKPTLIILQNGEDLKKINDKQVTTQLIQDPNLVGLIILFHNNIPIQEEIHYIFLECQLPIIQVYDFLSIQLFQRGEKSIFPYNQLSVELNGLMEKGFAKVASELAVAVQTPLIFLNENNEINWQTGDPSDLDEANHWIQTQLNKSKIKNVSSTRCYPMSSKIEDLNPYELYTINIAGKTNQTLVTHADLVDWQKKMIDKLVGLTALLLQTEEMFLGLQQQIKEHFIYDLLYHKFESKKVMVQQAKNWGWNLEKPHHLLVINITLPNESMKNASWLDEISQNLETVQSEMKDRLNFFSFQDQIVALLEDEENRTNGERKQHVIKVANKIEQSLISSEADYQFYIGIGKWYQDTINLNKSYQEAKRALQFGQIWFENKSVCHINDLGILHLLSYVHQELLFDFSQEYLSQLIESDQERGTEYIKTLKAFIQHQGIINEVSDELFIHPNTLRNRIKKIEEITGVNLLDPEEFMNLAVAVKIRSFMEL